jgi:nicotinamide phosphoribosyltransferase
MRDNILLNSDSYKYSQYNQYPEGTQYVYSYIESRGGEYDKLVYNGLQPFLNYLRDNPVTMEMIDEAEPIITAHGLPFYREGFENLIKEYGGHWPVSIRGLDEGTVVPPHTPLVTIRNMDKKYWWVTSWLETALLRAIWYPTTVASNSYHSKQIIKHFMLMNSDNPDDIEFRLHDFGARGVSSLESAAIGGTAHLINFKGTDTVAALAYIREHYFERDIAGFSVPAMEHSTVTSCLMVLFPSSATAMTSSTQSRCLALS